MNHQFRHKLLCFCGVIFLSIAGGWTFSGSGLVGNPDTMRSPYGLATVEYVTPGDLPRESETQEEVLQEPETPTFPPATDIAKDWEKPEVVLFVSGELHGYLEPCGCTGLANQKGGLLRRHTAQKILLDRGWNVVPVDTGNVIRRIGVQANLQLETAYQTLVRTMNYQAIAIGPDDLKTSATDLAQIMVNSFEKHNPFFCSNVIVLDENVNHRFLILEANGKKIGITSVISDQHRAEFNDPDIKHIPAGDGLAAVIPELKNRQCDMLVLVAHTSLEESTELAKAFPVFDLLVATGGAGDPTLLPEPVTVEGHTTHVIQVGVKGMHVGVVGLYTNPKRELRYERVPMDARFEDAAEVKVRFKEYQDRLKLLYENPDNFRDIAPRNHPTGYQFLGSLSCRECHEPEYKIWVDGVDGTGGPHYRATKDLTDPGERVWVKRNYDPECLSCHVTGWNPQNFYPYKTGYVDLNRDAHLHGNGCENCHGPGSAHDVAEKKAKQASAEDQKAMEDELKRLRKEMQVTLKQAREGMCMECHDLDNSPDFFKDGAFDVYWKKIKH